MSNLQMQNMPKRSEIMKKNLLTEKSLDTCEHLKNNLEKQSIFKADKRRAFLNVCLLFVSYHIYYFAIVRRLFRVDPH